MLSVANIVATMVMTGNLQITKKKSKEKPDEYDFQGYCDLISAYIRDSNPQSSKVDDPCALNTFFETIFKDFITPEFLFETRTSSMLEMMDYDAWDCTRSGWHNRCEEIEPRITNLGHAIADTVKLSSYIPSQHPFPPRFHNPLNNVESELIHDVGHQELLNSQKVKKLEVQRISSRTLSRVEREFVINQLQNVLMCVDSSRP